MNTKRFLILCFIVMTPLLALSVPAKKKSVKPKAVQKTTMTEIASAKKESKYIQEEYMTEEQSKVVRDHLIQAARRMHADYVKINYTGYIISGNKKMHIDIHIDENLF